MKDPDNKVVPPNSYIGIKMRVNDNFLICGIVEERTHETQKRAKAYSAV